MGPHAYTSLAVLGVAIACQAATPQECLHPKEEAHQRMGVRGVSLEAWPLYHTLFDYTCELSGEVSDEDEFATLPMSCERSDAATEPGTVELTLVGEAGLLREGASILEAGPFDLLVNDGMARSVGTSERHFRARRSGHDVFGYTTMWLSARELDNSGHSDLDLVDVWSLGAPISGVDLGCPFETSGAAKKRALGIRLRDTTVAQGERLDFVPDGSSETATLVVGEAKDERLAPDCGGDCETPCVEISILSAQ